MVRVGDDGDDVPYPARKNENNHQEDVFSIGIKGINTVTTVTSNAVDETSQYMMPPSLKRWPMDMRSSTRPRFTANAELALRPAQAALDLGEIDRIEDGIVHAFGVQRSPPLSYLFRLVAMARRGRAADL